jgi:uncharacterized protein
MTLPAAIYVFFGFTATGKSTLARAWAHNHALAYHNTDMVRKGLAGLSATTRQLRAVETGIYSREFSRRTYGALLEKAEEELQSGRGVVLDGSYQRREERLRVRALAQKYASPVYFILCTCPEPLLQERFAVRARDPGAVSDGRWEIYLQQKEKFDPPTELLARELIVLDTAAPVAELNERLDATIRQLTLDR